LLLLGFNSSLPQLVWDLKALLLLLLLLLLLPKVPFLLWLKFWKIITNSNTWNHG